jgi:hypothetical protein
LQHSGAQALDDLERRLLSLVEGLECNEQPPGVAVRLMPVAPAVDNT